MTDTDRLTAALSGRYLIERALGEGGMATVYLANDLKHDRKVALKVLKPELAAVVGADRFLAEIRTTANLQHPHILPLFDSGEADGFLYYVMPYVEGETLRDRLDREKQLPVEEAVRIATEVADALGHAHSKGVIHRDIKPANLLLRDGRVQVADFGIALAVSAAGGSRLTETGLSVGTPHYMSPEQATGDRELDGRSDIYSLGCVLYEMLGGEPPHTGPTAQSILSKILTEDPKPLGQVRSSVPPHVEAAVHAALEKLPADRIQSASEFARALAGEQALPRYARRSVRGPTRLAAFLGVALAAAVIGWIAGQRGGNEPSEAASTQGVRFALTLPEDHSAPPGSGTLLALSPDGRRLAYISEEGGVRRLFVRPIDTIEAKQVGYEDAFMPFFSPDGDWVYFSTAADKAALRRAPAGGGPAQDFVRLPGGLRGAAWTADGNLIVGVSSGGLHRVDEDDNIQPLTTPPEGWNHWFPQVLPGGSILYTSTAARPNAGTLEVLDIGTSRSKALGPGSSGHYLETGHLLYVQEGTLWVVGFDVQRLELAGTPVPVVDDLRVEAGGTIQLAIADDGSIAYLAAAAVGEQRTLVWVDPRDPMGTEMPIPGPPRAWVAPRVSPDGRWVASDARDLERDVWIMDGESGSPRPLTRDPGWDSAPTWHPDGTHLAFTTEVDGRDEIYWQSASGSGLPAPLTENSDRSLQPRAFTPDGESVLFTDTRAPFDIGVLRVADRQRHLLWQTPTINERNPSLSPDGLWLAYESDQGMPGQYEIWISPFPEVDEGGGRMVSSGGGTQPVWAPNLGRLELFYWTETGGSATVMGGPVRVGQSLEFLEYYPTIVIGGPYVSEELGRRSYDVAPDGRFLLVKSVAPEERTSRVEIIWWHRPVWPRFARPGEGHSP